MHIRQSLLLTAILGCMLTAGRSLAQEQPGDKAPSGLDIYLLIGQSNMAGRAEYKPGETDTLQNVYLFTKNGWIAAANPLNKYSNVRKTLSMQKLGPGYSFAREVASRSGRKIGLVVNARGGSAIEWWEKGYTGANDFDLYENTILRAREALKYGTLKGIIWHQGESNQSHPAGYNELLKRLVKDLRHDLGARRVYFVAGEIGRWRTRSAAMNHELDQIPRAIRRSAVVTTEGLTPLHGDTTNPHFDTPSQITLGERYASKVLEKIYHIRTAE